MSDPLQTIRTTPYPTISIVNASTVLTDADINKVMNDVAVATVYDLGPWWGVYAWLRQVNKGFNPYPLSWWVVIADNSDTAGALGYHDLTPQGMPISKVFAKTDLDAGASWTVTLTHEIFEMLVDPWLVAASQDPNTGTFYATEVGDAVEGDQFGYMKGNTLISDFVTPAWFEGAPIPAPYDFKNHTKAPFELITNGYISIWDPVGKSWTMKTAGEYKKEPVGSRRERRIRGRQNWNKSTITFDQEE